MAHPADCNLPPESAANPVQFWCPSPCNYLAASVQYCMAVNTWISNSIRLGSMHRRRKDARNTGPLTWPLTGDP